MAMLVDDAKMAAAVKDIGDASKEFKTKATTFIADLTNALSTFEGETKDALMDAKIGKSGEEKEGTLVYFVEKQIPDLLEGLSKLLEGNRTTVIESDAKLAEAIRGNQG